MPVNAQSNASADVAWRGRYFLFREQTPTAGFIDAGRYSGGRNYSTARVEEGEDEDQEEEEENEDVRRAED